MLKQFLAEQANLKNHLILETMKSRYHLTLIILRLVMRLLFATNGVNASVCSVNPKESVVIVGEMTSIECVATGQYIVDSWIQGKAVTEGMKIYQVPAYRRDGTARVNQTLADGYFISYKDDRRMTLQMNDTTLWQAGPYFCKCEGEAVGLARANVGVVDFLPTFSFGPKEEIYEAERVDFNCSISFNGSINASFDLFINDSNGKTLSRQSNLPFSIDKKSYQVNHSVNADPAEDQTFTCSVEVINGSTKSIIYSKRVNASLTWEPVSEVFISCDTKSCSSEVVHPGDKLRCNANGRPRPTVFKWWIISNNGKSNASITENGTDSLVLDKIGHFTYRCYTYNVIRNATYEAFSSDFNVKVEKKSKVHFIIGATIVTIVLLIVATIVVLVVLSRSNIQIVTYSVCAKHDLNNKQIHTFSKQESAKQEISVTKQQAFSTSTPNMTDSEVVLCDNELYGAAKSPVDPSDGYLVEMPYYASINKK